ncbi:enoyl-CoA delta isomerase 2, mitochondrial [Drosophila busckii]|uniref:enoyl-CoA delta isomerase 2, mitochondrial n=1 Tax=Drosophila busckii TaxID=30019 RepID=UPI00083EE763|nr:enoyl-CoA delta isomerase 2, mitochondrial [Drosophila busckii]
MSGGAGVVYYDKFKELLVSRRGRLFTIQFHRPAVQNALRRRTVFELLRALDIANYEPDVSVVVLTGDATAFTAGMDISEVQELQQKSGVEAVDVHFNASSLIVLSVVKKMLVNRKVLVALVQGNCVGIGVPLCALCDIVYATETANFWMPFTKLGICAESGASWTLPQLLGHSKASELLLFGERMDARTALQYGFVANIVSSATEFWARMEQHAQLPTAALLATKRLLQHSRREQLIDVVNLENIHVKQLRTTPYFRAQIMAFGKRKNQSKL